MVNFLTVAIESFEADAQDLNQFFNHIGKAKDALMQLVSGLDFENEIAQGLYDIYLYAGECLNKALFSKDVDAAKELKGLFTELLEGWQAIEGTPDDRIIETPLPEDISHPQDGAHIYAGLTYGKDGELSEYIPESEDRGFKA